MPSEWPIPIDHSDQLPSSLPAGTRASASPAATVGNCRTTRRHGTSHSRVASPKTMNIARQPNEATISPPVSVPTAGPSASPAATAALAMPRCSGGTCMAMILDVPGKAMLSPTPSMTRSTSSDANPPTNPIIRVLAAHSTIPPAINLYDGEAVAQPADHQLHRGIDPEEGRHRDPEGGRAHAELALHHRRRHRDRAAVDIVEEHRRAEQQHQPADQIARLRARSRAICVAMCVPPNPAVTLSRGRND